MALQLDDLEIDLSRSKYYVTIEGYRLVSTDFSSLPKLLEEADLITKVKIIGYKSNKDFFKSLLDSISPKSYEVDLSNNLLEKDGIDVANKLGSSKKIIKIDLSNNSLKEYGPSVLAALASESIVDICLANNWIRSCDKAVLEKYESFTSSHHIDLSGNNIESLMGVDSDVLEVIL